ncbi:Vitellogenin, partial [Operophtera brumata]
MDNYTELFIDEAEKILSTSWHNPYQKTVMFCHGFTGYPKGPAITAVISAYLSLGKYNVALLNWEKLAAYALPGLINSYMNWALPNAMQVPYFLGADLSETLLRVTGLDPAIGFDMKPALLRLSPTSARFVSVIHSDPNQFGSKKELGLVDFWPNFKVFGPVLQPGYFCSHNRAWEIFVDALLNPGTIFGSHAKHFRMWN